MLLAVCLDGNSIYMQVTLNSVACLQFNATVIIRKFVIYMALLLSSLY